MRIYNLNTEAYSSLATQSSQLLSDGFNKRPRLKNKGGK